MSDRPDKGAVLAVVLLVLIVLGVLGMVISLRSTQGGSLSLRGLAQTEAFWIAEGGIQKSYWDIVNNSCQGMVDQSTHQSCGSCACLGGNKVLSGNLGAGAYNVIINAATTQLNSTGAYTLNANAGTASRQIQVRLVTQPLFGYAAFSAGAMTFSNNALSDSYNSQAGAYGGANVGAEGSIGTNSGAVNGISLSNNVTISGNVSTGVGGTVQTGAGTTIAGSVTHANNVSLPSVIVPSGLAGLASSGTLSFLNNETKSLSGGDYKYDTISLSNNNQLIITGDVRIYLTNNPALVAGNNGVVTISSGGSLTIYTDGVVTFDNNVLLSNVDQDPSKLIIFSTYTGANGVTISNNGNFYGAIYAPETDINVSNNADIFGSMVGETVNISNNGQVHYDTALGTIAAPNTSPLVRDWQEI